MDKISRQVRSEPRKKREKVARPQIERKPYSFGPTEKIESAASTSWPEAVEKTLERIRRNAKLTNESEATTNKKVEAVTRHDPKNGDIVVVNIGTEEKKILLGIKIK